MTADKTPLVVPSDVTICERLYASGTRELTLLEKLGLLLTPNPIRFNFTKNDRQETADVLTKTYEETDSITEILLARQRAVQRKVKSRVGTFLGTISLGFLTLYTLRYHSIKTKVIVTPFAFYFGSIIGEVTGNGLSGRWQETYRERALGELPSKRYLTKEEMAALQLSTNQ